MNRIPVLAALLSLACAVSSQGVQELTRPIWVRSHNNSEVDVYVLCGGRDARWLGVVDRKGGAAFEIPARQADCFQGLNFFLVVRNSGRGYWAGPLRPQRPGPIEVVIEKYAGLSRARQLQAER